MLAQKMKAILIVLFAVVLCLGCNKNLGTPPPPGPKWRVFTKETTPLVDNTVNTISIDADGKIWFGTNGGASALRTSVWKSYINELAYTADRIGTLHQVNAITNANDGSTWFGLNGGGVRRFLPTSPSQQWTSYRQSDGNSISADVIGQMASDQFGIGETNEIWCLPLLAGISRFQSRLTDPINGDWTNYSTFSGIPPNWVTSVQVNLARRTVWFGTHYGQLFFYNGNGWSSDERPNNYNGQINTIAVENGDIIWAGTIDGAFRRAISWRQYTTADGLPSNNVHAIVVDIHNTKWFGTSGGFARFDNSSWSIFNRVNSPLPSDTVQALAIDEDGKIWIGTTNGAAVYDPNGK